MWPLNCYDLGNVFYVYNAVLIRQFQGDCRWWDRLLVDRRQCSFKNLGEVLSGGPLLFIFGEATLESVTDGCDVNKGEDVRCDIATIKTSCDLTNCELLTLLVIRPCHLFPKTMPSEHFQKNTGQGPYVSFKCHLVTCVEWLGSGPLRYWSSISRWCKIRQSESMAQP